MAGKSAMEDWTCGVCHQRVPSSTQEWVANAHSPGETDAQADWANPCSQPAWDDRPRPALWIWVGSSAEKMPSCRIKPPGRAIPPGRKCKVLPFKMFLPTADPAQTQAKQIAARHPEKLKGLGQALKDLQSPTDYTVSSSAHKILIPKWPCIGTTKDVSTHFIRTDLTLMIVQ